MRIVIDIGCISTKCTSVASALSYKRMLQSSATIGTSHVSLLRVRPTRAKAMPDLSVATNTPSYGTLTGSSLALNVDTAQSVAASASSSASASIASISSSSPQQASTSSDGLSSTLLLQSSSTSNASSVRSTTRRRSTVRMSSSHSATASLVPLHSAADQSSSEHGLSKGLKWAIVVIASVLVILLYVSV